MPVHAVEGGFRWGSSGKTYKTRAEAERQAAAIYATGWREDSPRGRKAKREMHAALSPSKRAEARYTRDIIGIMRGVHRGVMALVDAELPKDHEARHDATGDPWRGLGDKIADHVRPRVGLAFDRMATLVDKKGVQSSTLIGIAPKAPGILAAIAQARENNIRLVEDAGRAYAADVRAVFTDPATEGLRSEVLRDKLLARGNVSLSRANLIAVDQTLKLSSNLNQARQRAAGVERYTWSTSRDERVRPMHAALEGQTFSWDDPPETNDDGETNNPGEDYRCRCVAIPVIGDDEELPDDDEEKPGEDEPEPDEEPEPEPLPEPERDPEPEIDPDLFEPEEPPAPAPEVLVPPPPEPAPAPPAPAAPEPVQARQLTPEMFRNGFQVGPKAGVTAAQVLEGFDHPGLADWLADPHNAADAAVVTSLKIRGAEGVYSFHPRYLQGQAPGQVAKIGVQTRLKPLLESQWSKPFGETWTVSTKGYYRAPTKLERLQGTLVHEFGHHVHLGAHAKGKGVDEVVLEAWRKNGLHDPTKRHAAMRGESNPAVSRYAATDPREYFAESFAAYMKARGELELHDPVGFQMVKDVLEKVGIDKPKS